MSTTKEVIAFASPPSNTTRPNASEQAVENQAVENHKDKELRILRNVFDENLVTDEVVEVAKDLGGDQQR